MVLSKGYGSANLEWDIPNTPSTKFRLGSITKQFTAASILLLTLPMETLSQYVGTYEVAPGVNVWIRLDGDHLTTQLAGQAQLPIFAKSETLFFFKVVEASSNSRRTQAVS